MAVKRFAFLANDFTEPFADDGAVDVVVIDPVLVSRVVRRVDLNALDLTGLVRKERLERDEIVALNNEVARAGVAAGQVGHVLEQVKRNLLVVIHHSFLPDPVQRGHNVDRANGSRWDRKAPESLTDETCCRQVEFLCCVEGVKDSK